MTGAAEQSRHEFFNLSGLTMQELSATFTQRAIDALKSSLRPFDQSLGAVNAEDAPVAAYLDFYQLPKPSRDLDVFVGRIVVSQTAIFSSRPQVLLHKCS